MTSPVELESELRSWMDAEAPGVAPDDLLATVLSHTAVARQRPPWLPRLDLPATSPSPLRMAWLLALIVLLVAAMAGALLVGQPPVGPASARNGLIALVGEGGGGWDLYLADPDGGVTPLTDTAALEWSPVWSPDGTRLAFVREVEPGGPPTDVDCEADPPACERGTPGQYAIVVTTAARDTESVIFESAGVINALGWSPDGMHLSFVNERLGGLLVLDLGTGNSRLVFDRSVEGASWSPDGRRLATNTWTDASDADIYIAYPDGREPMRLTSGAGFETSPTWSPDGGRIALNFDPDGSARDGRIEVMAADGSGRSVLAEEAYGPAWSPDGTRIAFVKTFGDPTGRSNEVWIMASDGSRQRKLADEGSRPRWSPDGELLFWLGDDGIWSVRPDGSELTKMLTGEMSRQAGMGFDWQPVLP